ncbi:hypothetical protein VNO78_08278 [Psophocarpus tetragonolobus]|uniref:Uncharacterized protein n=1 Tax=Psophocarpus tetragonolobus TaxID=3891 RepID=A0AAN9SXN7_PSOTE
MTYDNTSSAMTSLKSSVTNGYKMQCFGQHRLQVHQQVGLTKSKDEVEDDVLEHDGRERVIDNDVFLHEMRE